MSHLADPPQNSAPTSPQFAATLQRAFVYAEEQAHRLVTAEHLLLALSEDADCIAVLRRKAIDLDHLRNEVAGLVSRNNDRFSHGDAGQPIYGADLLRILTTASGAASSRRPIDGALVLAAMIADGQTPAAELIKLYGLTFDDAARGVRPQPVASAVPPEQHALATLRSEARQTALGLRRRAGQSRDDQEAGEAPAPASRAQPAFVREQLPADSHFNGSAQSPPREANRGLPPQDHRNGVRAQPAAGNPYTNGDWDTQPQDNSALPPGLEPVPEVFEGAADFPSQRGDPGLEDPGYLHAQTDTGWQDHPQSAYLDPPPPQPDRQNRRPEIPPEPRTERRKANGQKGSGRARRKGQRAFLIETIPRRMRAGIPVEVEARIARHEIEATLDDLGDQNQLQGRGNTLAQAIEVRLRSVDGSIHIENSSPETQWVDSTLGLIDDDFASWRWTITPNSAGSARMQMVISARTVTADGEAVEIALPDQTVDVSVGVNFSKMAPRIAGKVAIVVLAAIFGAIGEHALGLIGRLLGH